MTLLGALPRKVALRVGASIGVGFFVFDSRNRNVALANLRRAFSDKSDQELRAILRTSCRNLGRLLAEVCHFGDLTTENVERYVTIEDPDAWNNAMKIANARGVVILTAHFGNFELLAYSQALRGTPVTLAHRTMRNPLVDREIIKMRERPGTRSLPKKNAARGLLRALRNKEKIAILADQNQTSNAGVFANFFGIPACTTPGPARLAAHTKAPIYPIFLVRQGESEHHHLVLYPPIEVVDTGDVLHDTIETTERCNRAIERILTDYPEQWIWFHKRWRTRPEGEPGLY